ncbi:MAG: NAD(+)/NADH kinase, partial [Clostridia bacterium]|nr:NAD(+)/NADH kinase [Clostridia bacterium]
RGEYTTSSRMLLSCRIGNEKPFYALNEFVIAPEKGFHIVELSLFENRKKLCDFRADGLIFNTPTGSTGYAFSAGGAVVDASFDCIGVKAVSSYLLINSHHMIFSPETVFTVKGARCEGGNVTVCADGRETRSIAQGDQVKILRGEKRVNLIFLKERSNLEVFFRKF